jgi:tRNA-binding protein
VIAVVNFPARQIADVSSECLVLGLPQENGEVVLLQPERKVQTGNRVS